MNEFFTFITCKDFKVQPIAETNEFSVFVGVRPLFYHFVLLREVDGFCSYQQFHLHKFDLANEYLFHKNKAANNNEKKWLNSPFRWSLQMKLSPEMDLWMTFEGEEALKIEPEIGQWFLDELETESKRVAAAIENLENKKNQLALLRKLKLPPNEAYDFTKMVWKCIQYEKDLLAFLKKKTNGISHLYSQSLNEKTELSERDLDYLTEPLLSFDPLCTCDFCVEHAEMFDEVQTRYFPQRIFKLGEKRFELPTIKKGVQIMFNNLRAVDRLSLLYLINDSPMLLVTLSYFADFKTEQDLLTLVCGGFQPDSKEEQEVSMRVSLISWLRKIA